MSENKEEQRNLYKEIWVEMSKDYDALVDKYRSKLNPAQFAYMLIAEVSEHAFLNAPNERGARRIMKRGIEAGYHFYKEKKQ